MTLIIMTGFVEISALYLCGNREREKKQVIARTLDGKLNNRNTN